MLLLGPARPEAGGRTERMPGSRFPGDASGDGLRPGSQVEGAGCAGQVTGDLGFSSGVPRQRRANGSSLDLKLRVLALGLPFLSCLVGQKNQQIPNSP